jgi:hypothetical protein
MPNEEFLKLETDDANVQIVISDEIARRKA